MRKQVFNEVKKMTAILLFVFFLMAMTSIAVSADTSNGGGSGGTITVDNDIKTVPISNNGEPGGVINAPKNAPKETTSKGKSGNPFTGSSSRYDQGYNTGYEKGYSVGEDKGKKDGSQDYKIQVYQPHRSPSNYVPIHPAGYDPNDFGAGNMAGLHNGYTNGYQKATKMATKGNLK